MRSFISHFRVRQLRTDFLRLSDSTGKTLPSSVPIIPVFRSVRAFFLKSKLKEAFG